MRLSELSLALLLDAALVSQLASSTLITGSKLRRPVSLASLRARISAASISSRAARPSEESRIRARITFASTSHDRA